MRLSYLYLPRFPVQRRVNDTPSLSGRPVLLHADDRGVQRVRFASGSAQKRGIRPGQTVASASALEPSAVRLPFEPEREAAALLSLGEALLPLAPGFQVDAPEGLWLDASAAKLLGGEARWADRVLAACRAAGFKARCVVGSERFTTQALARWRNDSLAVVPPRGGVELPALPLGCLEDGWLGPDAAAPFRALGLSTLGELAGLPAGALVARFGNLGLTAARLCRGEDDSRFVADTLPEVLEETVLLDWPAEALEPVLFALKTAVDRLCARLQGRQQAAVRLLVTVGLDRGAPLQVPLVLARPSGQSKLLVELIRHRLTDLTVAEPISALTVRVDERGRDPGRQLELGDAPAGEAELEVVLSRLQSALGEDALFSAEPVARHRPEEGWSPRRFFVPSPPLRERGSREDPGEGSKPRWPKRKAKTEAHPELSLPTVFTRPPRLFKTPAHLTVELATDGRLTSMNVAGRRRKVHSLWGPERLTGGWWTQDVFSRDYYRVELDGVGQLWVFRDGRDGEFYAQGIFD
ncbi:MAG: DNA polymerase Y family protein [Myxococcales bacterium]|nr:DNA polymerase Y family protein [Myxococcales bacterium]